MLLIETYISTSSGRGLGLFTKNDLLPETKYWIRNEEFDKVFKEDDLQKLPKIAVEYLTKYGFQEITGNWYLCGDNARYTNHSIIPNTSNIFDNDGLNIFSVVNQYVKAGEEIFLNYAEICLTCKDGIIFSDTILL